MLPAESPCPRSGLACVLARTETAGRPQPGDGRAMRMSLLWALSNINLPVGAGLVVVSRDRTGIIYFLVVERQRASTAVLEGGDSLVAVELNRNIVIAT